MPRSTLGGMSSEASHDDELFDFLQLPAFKIKIVIIPYVSYRRSSYGNHKIIWLSTRQMR